jgi:thiol-disulfide isomerase/thioredoxin
MKKLARFALVITLLFAYFPPARSAAAPTPANVSLERWLNGAGGYARAVELQKELNVPLIVYFYTDWCGYCRILDNQYLPSAPVQDYLRGVVKVRINPEHGQAERALANRYGVNGYPSFFVMRNSATRSVDVHPFRRGGNLTPAEFAKACRVVAPISQKLATGSSAGTSGKFRERPDVVTKVTTTKGGGMMVTVVPPAPASRKATGKKP